MIKCFHLSLLIAIILKTNSLYAQKLDLFKGEEINKKNDKGAASYTYLIDSAGNKVKDGNYSFLAEYNKTDACNQYIFKNYSGKYRLGKKNAKWVYESNTYTVHIDKIQNYTAKTSVSGVNGKITAQYNFGRATGQWSFQEDVYLNGKLSTNLRKANVNFNYSKLSGKFNFIENESDTSFTINGQFDTDGNFDGQWELNYVINNKKFKENREYKNGFLLQLNLIEASKDSIIYMLEFEDVKRKLESITSSNNDTLSFSVGDESFSLLFDDGYTEQSPYKLSQHLGNSILLKAMDYICSDKNEVFALDGVDSLQDGTTKRFKYKYTDAEVEMLQKNTLLLDSLQAALHKYLHNKSFVLHSQKSDYLAFINALYHELDKKLLTIKEANFTLSAEMFKYQNRENYFKNGMQALVKSDSIFYQFDEQLQVKPIEFCCEINNGKNIIRDMYNYSLSIESMMQNTTLYVERELDEIKKEIKIQHLEDVILQLTDSVSVLYFGNVEAADNLKWIEEKIDSVAINHLQKAVFVNLINYKRKKLLQEYSNLSQIEEKQAIGTEIINLLEIALSIYPKLDKMPNMLTKLDESFTRYAYNPYVDKHDIRVRIKKKFYQKTVLELCPYLYDVVASEKNYLFVNERIDQIENLFVKLVEISKQDDSQTKKLERKVRKEKDFEKVLKIILEYE